MSSSSHRRKPPVLYENRYCNQDEFNFVICGGKSKGKLTNEVTELKGPDFNTSVQLTSMITPRSCGESAVIGSDIYVLGGYDTNTGWISSFEMYSTKKKQWKSLTCFTEKKDNYSVCSFMKSVYVIGGYSEKYGFLKHCLMYSKESDEWIKIASLNIERGCAACTVFEGKIVVTGGRDNNYFQRSV